MARDRRWIPDYSEKMHPLFSDLYLNGDPYDSDEVEELRTERARARARRKVLQRRRGRRTHR